jgi:hypothetical protein
MARSELLFDQRTAPSSWGPQLQQDNSFSHGGLWQILPIWQTTWRQPQEEIEALWRTEHIPELNGIINTETEEQLHSAMGRDRYFMNNMSATRHIFLFRSNVDLGNSCLNKAATEHLSTALHCSTKLDGFSHAAPVEFPIMVNNHLCSAAPTCLVDSLIFTPI